MASKKTYYYIFIATAIVSTSISTLTYNTANMIENDFKPSLEKLSKTNVIGTLVRIDYDRGFLSSNVKSEWLKEDG